MRDEHHRDVRHCPAHKSADCVHLGSSEPDDLEHMLFLDPRFGQIVQRKDAVHVRSQSLSVGLQRVIRVPRVPTLVLVEVVGSAQKYIPEERFHGVGLDQLQPKLAIVRLPSLAGV